MLEKDKERQENKALHNKSLMPHLVKPMMARTKEYPFDSEEWVFEIKWDGYRAMAEIENGKVNLYSRNLVSFNHAYPAIIKSLETIGYNMILDGEIVVVDENGISSFQALQQYEPNSGSGLCYYVFDLLFLDGFDLRDLPLIERKNYLKQVLPIMDNIKYSEHIERGGRAFFKIACDNKLEGIMAKKADSPYRTNTRSDEWLKVKNIKKQEAIICGFVAPGDHRKGSGALILGVYENGKLVYVGHMEGEFDYGLMKKVKEELRFRVQSQSPFDSNIKTNEKVMWMEPGLVCEVAFAGWTDEGQMRHPVFEGLRIDKQPVEVVKEIEYLPPVNLKKHMEFENGSYYTDAAKKRNNLETKLYDEHKLKVSELDKVCFPIDGYTKEEVMNYYQQTAVYILPYLEGRAQSLNRHPNGITGANFFQKDMGESIPGWIETQEIYSEFNARNINCLVCNDTDTLMYMSNLGCIEINPWHSRTKSLEKPDYAVIDLDPGENTFDEVIETTLVVKEVLDRAGATCYCKTSGATGMHIYIPLGAKYDYVQSKNFTRVIVQEVHELLPHLTSIERSPKPGRKQIYLDYLQNRIGQTIAAPYSLRPREGATVSTPLAWEEVKKGLHPAQFTINSIRRRIEEKGDLFSGVLGKGIDIKKCLENMLIHEPKFVY